MHLVLELSGGRHFPRSQSVGFAVQCQLIGQQRTSCVSRGTDAPFWGDLFSWELSGALLRQLQASTPSLKLQVVMVKGEGVGRTEQALGHVVVPLKGVQHALPVQTWHALKPSGGGYALFGSRRHTHPPEIGILTRLLAEVPRPSIAAPPHASATARAGPSDLAAAGSDAGLAAALEREDRALDAPEPAGGASAAVVRAAAPSVPSSRGSSVHGGGPAPVQTTPADVSQDTEGEHSSDARLGSAAGPLFLSQRQRAELGDEGYGDHGEGGEGQHGEEGEGCDAVNTDSAAGPLLPSQRQAARAAAALQPTVAPETSSPAGAAHGAPEVESISSPGAVVGPESILSPDQDSEGGEAQPVPPHVRAGAEPSLATAAVAALPTSDAQAAIGQMATAGTAALQESAVLHRPEPESVHDSHAGVAAPIAPPPPPPPQPPPPTSTEQCELLVCFRMPAADGLASLLGVSPATSLVPRLRWLGSEVGSLSGSGGSWRLSVLLSGDVNTVLDRMVGAEPPLLCLHASDTDAPLALAGLPVGMLRRTRDGAELDETIELSAPLAEPATSSVRLGVMMRLRPRDVTAAMAREEDPHVRFTVRLRLLSLTLLRAPGGEPVSYTGEGHRDGWCALRLREYAGCPAQTAPAVRWVAGHPSDLWGEELTLALPNPPFTPRAALERLRAQPITLELVCGPSRLSVETDPRLLAIASLCLEDVCGGALTPLPRGQGSPQGEAAAATVPVSRAVELLDAARETVGRVQMQLTLQCVYANREASGGVGQPREASGGATQQALCSMPARIPGGEAGLATGSAGPPGDGAGWATSVADAPAGVVPQGHLPQQSFRFSISVRTVQDLSLPLGGYANVYCRFAYRLLELQQGTGSSRAVRSSPPVLLPKRGEVALPNGGCVFEFAAEPAALLQTLAHQPLLIELWHKDRYVKDVLLGIATVDLAEIVGVLPRASGRAPSGFVTTERAEELAVPVHPPLHPPEPLRRSADPNGGGLSGRRGKAGGERVALLRVGLRLEELGPAGAMPPASGRQAPPAPPPMADGAAPAEAALLKWRQREEMRWRSALKRREEELLSELSREWAAREAQREQALGQQRRVLAAVEAELKLKLAEVTDQQRLLRAAEGELVARGAAIEQKAAFDQAMLQSAALHEQARMQGELAASRATLGQAQAKVAMLEERLVAAEAREQRHDEAAIKMGEATAQSAAKALTLQAEVARLGAMLQELRGKHDAAVSAAEQRKQQALSAHRELHRVHEGARAREEQRLREQIVAERHAHEQLQLRAQADHEHLALAAEATELRRLQLQLQQIEVEHSGGGGTRSREKAGCRPAGVSLEPAGAAEDGKEDPVCSEVARLQGMCDDFVRSGMYAQGDRVLLLLQQRIGQLTGQPA